MIEISDGKRKVLRIVSGMGAVLLSIMLATGPASSQTLEAGGLTGEIRSATATAPPGTTTTVLFVPADSAYILTQACLGFGVSGSGILSGSELGDFLASAGCTVFTPGLAFQPGELITFAGPPPSPFPGPTSDVTSLITGVLVKLGTEDDD